MSDERVRVLERAAAAGNHIDRAALEIELARHGRRRLPEWFGRDGEEVFKYAPPEFSVDDVAETLADHEGENDGAEWWAVVRLFDGRFGYVEAGCDYTGWGCQEGGKSKTFDRLADLVAMHLSAEQRRHANWALPVDSDPMAPHQGETTK